MGKQSTTGDTAILWASNYSHAGYGFSGWNTEPDGTGTSYGPNETITLPNDMSEGLILYAMWVKSAGNLQEWGGCYTMNIGDVTALTDERDNDTYAIARLADGNCWMIENMRLDNTAELTTRNTNNPLNDGARVTLKHNYADTVTYNTLSPTSSVAYDATTAPEGWCNASSIDCVDQSRLRTDNTARRASNPTSSIGVNLYGYGNYYNWYSATAGNGNYNFSEDSNSIVGDLCPIGWRLPRGGSKSKIQSDDNDFWNLIVDGLNGGVNPANYNSSANPYYNDYSEASSVEALVKSYPNNFVYSGFASAGGMGSRGAVGNYWTSTAHNTGSAYFMYFDESSVFPGTSHGGGKSTGRSIRCLTPSIQWYPSEIDFDDGVTSVTLDGGIYGKYTVYSGGEIVRLAGGISYNISATYVEDYGFDEWESTSGGTIGNTASAETTFTLSEGATLTLYSRKVCSQGYICYDKNHRLMSSLGGDMRNQAVNTTSATLWASNYGRGDYGFAGWNTEPDGTGTSYGPNETIEFDPTDPNGLLLYAMWVRREGNLQGWTCPNDAVMPVGKVIGLRDTRDDQVYAVAKLVDGNCWMVENLRLADKDSNNNAVVLNSTNTNNPSLPLTNNNGSTSNSLSASQDPTVTAWCSDNNSACDDKSMLFTGNTTNSVAKMTDGDQSVYTYGNYYNWYSATAGHGKYSTGSHAVVDGDICPSNWFLPYGDSGTGEKGGNTNGGYYYLGVKLNATDNSTASSMVWRKYPNNFIFSGNIDASSITIRHQGGMYWTSTALGNNTAYSFSFGPDALNPGTGNNRKNIGRMVRCVTKAIPSRNVTVNFDDGVDGVVLQSNQYGDITVSTSGTTVQIRDGAEYTISGTFETEREFSKWETTANGTLGSTTSTTTSYAVSGDATLTLVSEKTCPSNRVCFNENGYGVEGSMGSINTAYSTSVNLYASNYKRSGYGFAGWNTEPDGSGTSYGPQETITNPTSGSTDKLRLYANWIPSAGTMQDWNGCSSMSVGDVTALTDSRDNDTYAVAKLADGNCWMIENLRLDNTAELSATNTNNPSLPITNVYDETNPVTSNHLSPTTDPYQTRWCSTNSDACSNQSLINTNNTTLFTNNTSADYSTLSNVYSLGNYYNWYSATAGNGKNGSDYGSGYTAPGDICPAGWRLPTGKPSGGELSTLNTAVNNGDTNDSEGLRAYPVNLVQSGYVSDVQVYNRGSYGYYWTSTPFDSSDKITVLELSRSRVYPGTSAFYKYDGLPVRCIVKN